MRCGHVWCGHVWCGNVQCGHVRCGPVRCGRVRCGRVRRGRVRCGHVRCGRVRCGHVRCVVYMYIAGILYYSYFSVQLLRGGHSLIIICVARLLHHRQYRRWHSAYAVDVTSIPWFRMVKSWCIILTLLFQIIRFSGLTYFRRNISVLRILLA